MLDIVSFTLEAWRSSLKEWFKLDDIRLVNNDFDHNHESGESNSFMCLLNNERTKRSAYKDKSKSYSVS